MDMSHDLTLSGWATDSNDPDSFFRPLLSCAAIASQTNYAHWCHREFDDVLQKALTSQQLASRIEAYKEAQRILADELPVLPLASSPASSGLSLRHERPGAESVWQRLFCRRFAGKRRRGAKTMIIFTLRRLLLLLITLFLLTFVGFSLSYFTPHAPLQGASLWNAWWFWFEGVLHWDFGVSSINGQPISEQLKEVFPATMELCILAFGFALVIGIPVGMLAGIMRNKWQDTLISALALLGFSIPVFWLALLLTLFFSLTLGWFPVSGRFDLLYEVKSVTGFALIDAWLSDSPWRHEMIVSAARHMVLPVLTLAVAPTTEVIRLMRISTSEVYDTNYVKAAATRGVSRRTILHRHVLHNALPPVIPRLGLQFSTMLTLAMITEMVFSWPGLGRWLINAIRQQDYAAISAGVMVIGALVIIVNVISDILGAMANPLKHKEWYALR
ncbi:peptide transport system permease protein sapB [Klebsiella oxytoca]|nr:peptide transport system permease protein sapB [Klebsiella oxytoca]